MRSKSLLLLLVCFALTSSLFIHNIGFAEETADQTKILSWDPIDGATSYFGNIYFKNGKIEAFLTLDTSIELPVTANLELIAVFGFGKFRPIGKQEIHLLPADPSKKPLPKPESTPGLEPSKTDELTEVFDYQDQAISSPEIDQTFDDFFSKRSKDVKSSDDLSGYYLNGSWGLGLQSNQESLLSQGLVGKFEGQGVSYGIKTFLEVLPRRKKFADLLFSISLDFLQFETDSTTTVEGHDPTLVTNRNEASRLLAKAYIRVEDYTTSFIHIGLGASYEKIPFFDIKSEDEGTGKLITRTSLGYALFMRYSKEIGLGDVIVDTGYTPIGSNLSSISQVDMSVSLRTDSRDGFGYFATLKSKYQKIRYLKECSENDDEACLFPKTQGYTIGPVLGLFSDL